MFEFFKLYESNNTTETERTPTNKSDVDFNIIFQNKHLHYLEILVICSNNLTVTI